MKQTDPNKGDEDYVTKQSRETETTRPQRHRRTGRGNDHKTETDVGNRKRPASDRE